MSSALRVNLKYLVVFALGLSVGLNVLFYLRLAGQRPAPQEAVSSAPPEPAPAAPVAAVPPEPAPAAAPVPSAPATVPSVPTVEESNAVSARPKPYHSVVFDGYNFSFLGDSDGRKALGSLYMGFNGVRSQSAPVKVSVEPALEELKSVSVGYGYVQIKGVFEIGRSYTVKLPKGMKIYDGETLENDYMAVVKIREPLPKVSFVSSGPYYQTKTVNGVVTDWKMPIKSTNVRKAVVLLWGLEERNLDVSENLIRTWDDDDTVVDKLMEKLGEKTVELKLRKNQTLTSELNIAELFPGLKAGVYAVALRIVEGENGETESYYSYSDRRKVVLSDLAISTVDERLRGTVAVCVRRLSDGSAVAGADVTLASDKRRILATAKSGEDGTVILKYDSAIFERESNPETIIARTADDITYIRLDGKTSLSKSEFDDSGRSFMNAYYTFVYTERGIYRQGETVHVSAFVRKREGDRMSPASIPVEFSVEDSRYVKLLSKTMKTNANGFATFELNLSDAAPSGIYTVECKAGGKDRSMHHFQVGSFVPDRIKLNAKAEKELVGFDEKSTISFNAEYYFGGRVEDARYSMSMYAKPAFPKHWSGYSVGNVDGHAVGLGKYKVSEADAKAGRMVLPSVSQCLKRGDSAVSTVPVLVSVDVDASEAASATVSKTVSFHAMRNPYYLGLKYNGGKENGIGEDDAMVEFRFLGWGQGEAVPFKKTDFELKLQKVTWEYVLAKSDDSSKAKMEWTKVMKDVASPASFELADESAVLSLPHLDGGHYVLVAKSVTGLESKLDFWHWHGSAGSVHSANPNILTASSDKESYLPGEKATLKFFSNVDGACFVAAGEEKIDSAFAVNVKKGENTVEVPIANGTLTSKYYVSVTVAGNLDGNITRSFGLLNLKVEQNRHRLALGVEAPEKAEPRQKITVRLKGDEAATAQVFAVDEGILSLTGYKTPDILEFFHGAYSTNLETSDIYSLLFPKLAINGPDKVGGGDEGGAAMRLQKLKEKKNAVVVLGAVEIPASGSASVELELPEHTGAMRIMAVAAGASKVGSAESQIILRDKMSVLPSLPVAVAVGDKFHATFKLFNHELDEGDAKLSVKLPPELKAEGAVEFGVKLAKGSSQSFSVPVTAAANGAFTVEYSMAMGGRTASGKAYVNVRPVVPFMTGVKNAILKPGETLELTPADTEWQSVADREVKVSSSPANAVADALEWLNAYPYGCLEQTTSKAFPMLGVDNLVKAGIVDAGFKPQAEKAVRNAVLAILSMRRGSRGFTGWIDSDTIWEQPGVYAAHFLFLAKSNLMGDAAAADIERFLRDMIDDNSSPISKAYAFYVLSLRKMEDEKAQRLADRLLNGSSRNGVAQFLIGAALYNAGFASRGIPLVKSALDAKVWSQSAKGLPWMLSSPTVYTALVLSIAMDTVPEHEATVQMALELAQSLRGDGACWGATRDNAFACVALGKFSAQHPRGEASVSFAEGDAPAKEYNSDNFSVKLAGGSRAVIRNTGKTDVFLRLVTKGIPSKPLDEIGTMSVKKEILDDSGKAVSKVQHGDLLTVKITVTSNAALENAVLLDLLPGGFAVEDGSLATRSKLHVDSSDEKPYISRQEIRADRYLLFGSIPNDRTTVMTYRIRAVTPGTYAVPPVRLEDMYEPDRCGTGTVGGSITVEQPSGGR